METNTTPSPEVLETCATFALTQPNPLPWENNEVLKFTVASSGEVTTYTINCEAWTFQEPAQIVSLAAKLVELAKTMKP